MIAPLPERSAHPPERSAHFPERNAHPIERSAHFPERNAHPIERSGHPLERSALPLGRSTHPLERSALDAGGGRHERIRCRVVRCAIFGEAGRWVPVLAVALVLMFSPASLHAQDSTRADFLAGHSPRGALWRAAAIPGWGQFYNRQYYKVPLVWAGLGGITYAALSVNQRYLLYRHAYHFVTGINTSEAYERDYRRLLAEHNIPEDRGEQFSGDFRRIRDNLRRNRDLLYIGIGLFYGLSVLEAYVSAHLLDFDVGEDLTLSISPVPGGFAANVRFGR